MKIISKYKDFYDYLSQDHDADIVYDRKPKFISERILNKFMDRGCKFSDPVYYPWNKNVYNIQISYIYFGVYPYIYMAPYLKVKTNPLDRPSYWINEFNYIFLNKENIESFKTRKDIIKFAQKYTSLDLKDDDFPQLRNHVYYKTKEETDIPTYIKKHYVGKIECKDIFKYIECPVFCEYNSNILDTVIYVHELDKIKTVDNKYIGNCCFNKLNKDMLKYWINELMNINTYINIENFLWSIKQEPIANPDNNTKIISHGFDLKTSFRKM